MADLPPVERHRWLSTGVAALAISGLGLAVAGSVVLTTHAESRASAGTAVGVVHSANPSVAVPAPGGVLGDASTTRTTTKLPPGVQSAFARRDTAVTSRDSSARRSSVAEQAAERTASLAQSQTAAVKQEQVTISGARAKNLASQEQQIQQNQARLAEQRRQAEAAAALAAAQRTTSTSGGATTTTTTTSPLGGTSRSTTHTDTSGSTTHTDTSGSTTQTDTSTATSGGGASPIANPVLGEGFGAIGHWASYHTGQDFLASCGTPIHAAANGVVLFAGNAGDWAGNHVAVQHADGTTTMSSHMTTIAASVGENVSAGEVIGYVGETGRAFGCHLHFEVYPAGVKYGDVYKAINPLPWLRARGVNL